MGGGNHRETMTLKQGLANQHKDISLQSTLSNISHWPNIHSFTAGGDNGLNNENPEEVVQRMLALELEATDSWRSQAQSKLPNQSDMLLAFATVPGE